MKGKWAECYSQRQDQSRLGKLEDGMSQLHIGRMLNSGEGLYSHYPQFPARMSLTVKSLQRERICCNRTLTAMCISYLSPQILYDALHVHAI